MLTVNIAEVNRVTWVQILNKIVYISHSAYTRGESLN